MIIKGAGRTNGEQLGSYLGDYLEAEKNDRVEVIEITRSDSRGLDKSLRGWEAEAKGGKCKLPLWHAQMRTPHGEALTREQQLEAVDILERHLGFTGQPRAVVIHEKDGHEHIHVVWSRIRREDETVTLPNGEVKVHRAGTAKGTSFTKRRNVEAAREIERTFGLQPVESPNFKSDDKSKSRQERRQESKEAGERQGEFKQKRGKYHERDQRIDTITRLWQDSDSAKAFRAALQDAGYILATGDQRAYVVVDQGGNIHSLARQIRVANTAEVKGRLAELDPASIPKADHIQQQIWRAKKDRDAEEELRLADANAGRPGIDSRSGKAAHHSNAEPGETDDPLDPAAILAALTKQHSTFTKSALYREIGKRLEKAHGSDDPVRKARIARAVDQQDDFLHLGEDRIGQHRFTSRQMLETELAMRDSSDSLASRNGHGIFRKIREVALEGATISLDQTSFVEHLASAGDLKIGVGYAGSGKSTAMTVLRKMEEAAGHRIRGVALAGIAAQSLQEGSGIQSQTLHSLFFALDKLPEQEARIAEMDRRIASMTGTSFSARKAKSEAKANRDQFAARVDATRFTSRDVIVLDEAGMVGSEQVGRLLKEADKAKAKVILIGDAEQLQAIDAGGAFRALSERHGAAKLTEIWRQKADWQKAATKDFGDGFAREALVAYHERGHIHELATHSDALARVVKDWTASRNVNVNEKHLILAYTRSDVAELNKQARAAYDNEHRLGLENMVKTEDGVKPFATGDRLYFLQNDTRLKVKNGSLGTVESIQFDSVRDSHRLSVKLDAGKTVEFDTKDYAKFSHGYAATVHKSQGVTAGRAFVLASQFMDRHAAGVSMTRHVEQADMYYGAAEFKTFEHLLRKLTRDGRKDTTLDYLHRAEAEGKPERFWKRVNKVVDIVTKEEVRKRAFERFAEAVRLKNDPAAKEERAKRRLASIAAEKLRTVLDRHPEKKKKLDKVGGLSI